MDSVPTKPFWSLHTHSKFSVNDALPEVPAIVERAVELGYPALGLTDHGSPSGLVQLYKASRKAGIEPLPGIELYVTPDSELGERKNLHLTMAAYTETGYRNLMRLSTLSARRFYYKPRIDFADLAAMAEAGTTKGLVVSSGCLGGVLPQVLLNQGHEAGVKLVKAMAGWFPRFYIELQSHGIDIKEHPGITDEFVLEWLWDVAQETGIPVILARDSHYISPEDQAKHEALKQLVSWSDDVDDATFSGEGYFMTDAQGLKAFYPPKILRAGLDGLEDLANAAYVRLPELETFAMKVPDVSFGGDPQAELEEMVVEAMPEWMRKDSRYQHALREELDVIRAGHIAAYLLLVILVADFMREKKIRYQVRGSASGSLVLHLMKVTQLDPVKGGLRFDRFLSRNRMKPPDVDFDVEHLRRDEVIQYLQSRWAVRSVGSLMKYSLFTDDGQEGDHGKGSLRVKYYSSLGKRGLPQPQWRDIPAADKKMLFELADLKLISGYGTHAAGYIVAPNEEVLQELPLAYIPSSKKLVTAYGKKDVEILGFLKLDLLGLRTLTAIRLMEETTGISFEQIPETDARTYGNIAQGNNAGVFQLDGYAMTLGCKQLRPKNMADIIAAQALYRPATRNSGATADFIARRFKREPVPERHADIMESTKETFGVLLYQEQVMDVMQKLGMNSTELEEMLDAVKASNEYSAGAAVVIERLMPRIKELAVGRGWQQVDIDWLADGLGAYADYSFNKAHAASYGLAAYRTAWMKTHHPIDFWHAMLRAYDDHDNVKEYTMAARRDGVRMLPPHVNESGVSYSMVRERNAIRRGLLAVKGVGPVAATELAAKAPFTSLTDLGQRVLPRRVTGAKGLALKKTPAESGGCILALYEAGALEGLEV